MKIRIEDNKTSCTISEVDTEHVGTYVCKAVSDLGVVTTKAKLYVQEIPETKKKEILQRIAKEKEEITIKEKVKVEKKREERRKKRGSITVEESKPLEVTSVQSTETVEEFTKSVVEEEKVKPTLELQEPVQVEAVASSKKIDQPSPDKPEEKATELISPQEPTYSEQVILEETLKDLEKFIPKDQIAKTDIQKVVEEFADFAQVRLEEIVTKCETIVKKGELKMAKEVSQLLDLIKAKEFGPGEKPLREIAEIGYLLRNGITIKEVTILYDEDKFPSLKTPHVQSALVNVVERKGYGPLITEVLTEETTIDETKLAATVGFRAFMKMVELNYVTIEEVITDFKPEDFMQSPWESTEVLEVT